MNNEDKIKRIISITLAVFLAISLNYLSYTGIIKKPMQIQDKELEPYVEFFKNAAVMYKAEPDYNNLIVTFVDKYPDKTWLALCQEVGNYKIVSVLRSHFEKAPMEEKYAIVVHELGHCALDRLHKGGYMANGCPLSIMHPTDSMYGCFMNNQEYYFSELFEKL